MVEHLLAEKEKPQTNYHHTASLTTKSFNINSAWIWTKVTLQKMERPPKHYSKECYRAPWTTAYCSRNPVWCRTTMPCEDAHFHPRQQ